MNTIHPLLFAFLFLFNLSLSYCQDIPFAQPLKILASEKIDSEIKKNEELFVYGLNYKKLEGAEPTVLIVCKNKEGAPLTFSYRRLDKFTCNDIDNRDMVWNKNLLFNETLVNLLLKGYQYDIRDELNTDAVEYINSLYNADRFYEDEYFEDYLYVLTNKIHDGILKDRRPGNIFIKILKDPEPNAFTLPNGCIILSTGLLSTIQSEDELIGVLAHEVAHFAMDHHILNYNQALDRKKRAEFWAAFATVVAASADVYLAANNENYIPGILTYSAAIGSTIISKEITERLGIKYSQQQELQADNAAKEILQTLQYNKEGLSVALSRIRTYCVLTGNYLALSGEGTHPSLDSRVDALGQPTNYDAFTQATYLKKVSFINSYNALIELESFAHQLAANELVNRNIENNVATETDYIIKAIITRRLSNTKESNEKVLDLLNKAKSLNINTPLQLYKEEAITYLRLDRKADAKKSLQTYLNALMELKQQSELKESRNYNRALDEQMVWTKKMVYKIDNL